MDALETGIQNVKMDVIRTKVGGAEVLIETVDALDAVGLLNEHDADVEVVGNQGRSHIAARKGNKNKGGDEKNNVYENVKNIIQGIEEEFSKIVNRGEDSPNEAKISFGISLTTEGRFLLIKGSSNMTFNVELTWKRNERDGLA